LAKHDCPKSITDDGITMDINPVLAKSKAPITERTDSLSKVIDSSEQQFSKQWSEILLTEDGTMKDWRAVD
jgi:hypothetical protein